MPKRAREIAPGWPHSGSLVLLLLTLLAAMTGCRSGFRGQTPGTPPASAQFVHPADLQAGDCFDVVETQTAEPLAAKLIPCNVPHDMEVYGAFIDSAPPGEPFYLPSLERRAEIECGRRYRESVEGTFVVTHLLDVVYYHPGEEAWQAGDRSVTCAVAHAEGRKLTRSYRKP